jgi:hypothetical protein
LNTFSGFFSAISGDGQCAVPVTPETPVDDLSRIVDMVTPFR